MKLDKEKLSRVFKAVDLPNGRQVVLIEAPTDGSWPKEECYSNIFCIDASGEVVWQVKAGAPKFDSDSFVSMNLKGNEMNASRFFGSEFRIDLATGIAEEVGWHK